MPKILKWTKEDDDFIKANWETLSIPAIAKHLGVGVSTVDRYAKDKLFLGDKPVPNQITETEKEYVEANWESLTMQEMANTLGVKLSRINNIADVLKKEGKVGAKPKRRKALKDAVVKLRHIKKIIENVDEFLEVEMYDVADEVEEILEVIKERLQEGLE